MTDIKLALDFEGVLITNVISQFPRPGLKTFLEECALLFGERNICVFTSTAHQLGLAPFSTLSG